MHLDERKARFWDNMEHEKKKAENKAGNNQFAIKEQH